MTSISSTQDSLILTIQILKASMSYINNSEIAKKNININFLLHILLVDINCALWMLEKAKERMYKRRSLRKLIRPSLRNLKHLHSISI